MGFWKATGYQFVQYAIDVTKYHYHADTRKQYRKMLGVENTYVIGYVGRLHEQKNLFRLLDICACVR